MSLTSEIKNSKSQVRQFFSRFEDKVGIKECCSIFQSTKTIRPLSFNHLEPYFFVVHSLIGTTVDYLIRYSAMGNKLIFEDTVAHTALTTFYSEEDLYDLDLMESLKDLYQIGKQYLDGRPATDPEAIYSATALSVLEKKYRGGTLPKLFMRSIGEKTTRSLLDEYVEWMGGRSYIEDIYESIKTFVNNIKDPESELFNARIVVFNQALENSALVGGADFDCVIEYNNLLVLTEIKTMVKPLGIEHIRQLIGYALLYDEEKDRFKFTDIGFYHSRSGSFRLLPVDLIIKLAFPSLDSIRSARKLFIQGLLSPSNRVSGPAS